MRDIGQPDYVVRLRPERWPAEPGAEPTYRLKRLLKLALRAFGMKCVSVGAVKQECELCRGEGYLPTDDGMVPCPRCLNGVPVE